MASQRYISTSFWDDPWVHRLDPSEKLMYLYLMTNPLTNIAGIYKITVDRMVFDTGFNENTVRHILEKFSAAGKSIMHGEYVIIPSWPKHQKIHEKSTVKTGVDRILESLPKEILFVAREKKYAYPIDTLLVGYAYPPTYLDLDSRLGLELSLSRASEKTSSEPPPAGGLNLTDSDTRKQNPGRAEFTAYIAEWNAVSGLAPHKRPFENIPNIGEAREAVAWYSHEEVLESIRNYAAVATDPKTYDLKYPYDTLMGFLVKGVEKFVTEAKPLDRFARKVLQFSKPPTPPLDLRTESDPFAVRFGDPQ